MLPGRPVFCKLRGLVFVINRSMLLLESFLFIGADVVGLEEGMLAVVGELEGLEVEKVTGRFFFLSRPPDDALSGGSSMGVNGDSSGLKMLRLFLRLIDMAAGK